MKSCPYCAESIQDEAIKCKHCGEWLNKQNTNVVDSAKSLFNKANTVIQEQREKRTEKRYRHLFAPANDTPFEVNEAVFQTDSFRYYGKTYEYSGITSIYFKSSEERMNGIQMETETKLHIFLSDIKIDLSRSSHFGIGSGKKTREKMAFIQSHLKKVTFEARLDGYLKTISENGYFDYPPHFRIYNDGKLEVKGKTIDNLVEANKKKRIDYGDFYASSPLGRTQYYDPFCMFIWKNEGSSRNLLFSKSTQINVYRDKDVFDALINKLLQDGTIFSEANVIPEVNQEPTNKFDATKFLKTVNLLYFECKGDIEFLRDMELKEVHEHILSKGKPIELVNEYEALFKLYSDGTINKESFASKKKQVLIDSLTT